MKNQYVGDVNDFVKFGLIRALTGGGMRSPFIAWLLTPDDAGKDGGKLGYLQAPHSWRSHDPELFEALKLIVSTGQRSVAAVAAAGILPGAAFHAEVVPVNRVRRRQRFERMLADAEGHELVFFDPDNGLEVPSCPAGRKDSTKYLLWRELTDTYLAGHSVLVYQHFPRKPREEFVLEMARRVADASGAYEVLTFLTRHVAFFLAPQHAETEYYAGRIEDVNSRWAKVIDSALIAVA